VEARVSDVSRTVDNVTCLGCGCACDDITVTVRDGRIAEAQRACSLGATWFGDGQTSAQVLVRGEAGGVETAVDVAAALLRAARRLIVFLSPDCSCETYRAAVGIADSQRALLDTATVAIAPAVLAAQRRGRAGATLGEVRNRADVVVFWGVDPARRYPRFAERYAPGPVGLFVEGRKDRTVIAVDLDDRETAGPADADFRLQFALSEELDAIGALRAAIAGRSLGNGQPIARRVGELASRLARARYAAIVVDAEPSDVPNPGRANALLGLAESLNATIRCALITLRGGGNRSGADAVLTWQTGFPMAVDFERGTPRYRPEEAQRWLADGTADTALLIGRWQSRTDITLPPTIIAVGPGATRTFPRAQVAIDTGVAGIHEGGTAFRMDDVPLPLTAVLPGALDTASVVRALAATLGTGKNAA
jgi:formylmethanofuran dehydrogenase subunit B